MEASVTDEFFFISNTVRVKHIFFRKSTDGGDRAVDSCYSSKIIWTWWGNYRRRPEFFTICQINHLTFPSELLKWNSSIQTYNYWLCIKFILYVDHMTGAEMTTLTHYGIKKQKTGHSQWRDSKTMLILHMVQEAQNGTRCLFFMLYLTFSCVYLDTDAFWISYQTFIESTFILVSWDPSITWTWRHSQTDIGSCHFYFVFLQSFPQERQK